MKLLLSAIASIGLLLSATCSAAAAAVAATPRRQQLRSRRLFNVGNPLTTTDYDPQVIAASSKGVFAIAEGELRFWGRDEDGSLSGAPFAMPPDSVLTSFSVLTEPNDFDCDQDPRQLSSAIRFAPSNASAPHPVPVEIAFVGANSAACVRLDDGGVRCWGAPMVPASLGAQDPSVTSIAASELPSRPNIAFADVGGVPQLAAQLSSGEFHACVVSTTNRVICWGRNNVGQLGIGSSTNAGDTTAALAAVQLPPSVSAVRVAAGSNATCVLSSAAEVFCWGDSPENGEPPSTGTVGDQPGDTQALSPLPLASGAGATVVQIWAAGLGTMCVGFSDGEVACWGGQTQTAAHGLDRNDTTIALQSPNEFAKIFPGHSVQLAAGALVRTHSASLNCVLFQNASAALPAAKCWGDGEVGLTAQGNTQLYGRSDTPGERAQDTAPLDFGTLPTGWAPRQLVAGGNVACTVLSACALRDAECGAGAPGFAVRCWGQNSGCALGVADSANHYKMGTEPTLPLAEWPNSLVIMSASPSATPSESPSPSASVTASTSPSGTGTHSPTPSASSTHTPSASVSSTHTPSASVSSTHTPSASVSSTHTPSASVSSTHTPSASVSAAASNVEGAPPVGATQTSDEPALSTGAIAGIAVAAVVLLGVVVVLLVRALSAPAKRTARQVETDA